MRVPQTFGRLDAFPSDWGLGLGLPGVSVSAEGWGLEEEEEEEEEWPTDTGVGGIRSVATDKTWVTRGIRVKRGYEGYESY